MNIVQIKKDRILTDSLTVAEVFKKNHDKILRDIRNITCSDEFRRANFGESSYINSQNKTQPMYTITRDGWTFLVMGFTGKKAARFKEQYIAAFNKMERLLIQKQNLSWKQQRLDGKQVRKELTDEIQQFVEYATAQGSRSAQLYYMNFSKLTNRALFMIKQKAPQNFRDMLDTMQLAFLQSAEFVARNAIRDGMIQRLHYKQIYTLARKRVEVFAASVGCPVQVLDFDQKKLKSIGAK